MEMSPRRLFTGFFLGVFTLAHLATEAAALTSPIPSLSRRCATTMSTTIPGTKEKTKTGTRRDVGRGWGTKKSGKNKIQRKPFEWSRGGPLEYLIDDSASRSPEDPCHILLLDKTFDGDRITVDYVSSSLTYVIGIPGEESLELTEACVATGFSCLGTWSREECLFLGEKLRIRDVVCRIVPFVEGGSRSWQAKLGDALNNFSESLGGDPVIDV